MVKKKKKNTQKENNSKDVEKTSTIIHKAKMDVHGVKFTLAIKER